MQPMDLVTIVLIAVGLAMDAFAVSIAKGIVIKRKRRNSALLLASFFGGFQMLMPVIGYFAAIGFRGIISGVDHWVAFSLLSVIGLKMIYDSTRKEDGKQEASLKLYSAAILALATSIDALMVGLSFAFLQTSIAEPILAIGVVAFSLSLVGFFFGCGLGRVFGNRIKIAGGLILIAIGLRMLLEHLF
jgi:putative Mn2+ efflux pump MntP